MSEAVMPVLPGRFMVIERSMGVPKGRASLQGHRIEGADVAPLRTR